MGKGLFVGAVVLTLVQVVISSSSPVRDAAMIGGGAVLLLVGLVERPRDRGRQTSALSGRARRRPDSLLE